MDKPLDLLILNAEQSIYELRTRIFEMAHNDKIRSRVSRMAVGELIKWAKHLDKKGQNDRIN